MYRKTDYEVTTFLWVVRSEKQELKDLKGVLNHGKLLEIYRLDGVFSYSLPEFKF